MEINWKSYLKMIGSIVLLYAVIHYWGNIEGFVKLGTSAAIPLIIGGIMAYAVNICYLYIGIYLCNLSAGGKREISLSGRCGDETLYERKTL